MALLHLLAFTCLSGILSIGWATEENVALGKTATQSETAYGGEASRAIDGNAATYWTQNSCTHTPAMDNPWWKVDLKEKYRVSSVKITNRLDCCSDRLTGAEIHIINLKETPNPATLCGKIGDSKEIKTFSFSCNGMEGQYVFIVLPGTQKFLTLCEVEVYGSKVPASGHC